MSSPAVLTTSLAVSSIPTPPPDGDDRSFFKNPFLAARSAMNFSPHQNHTAGGIVSPCPECGNDVVHPYLKELQQAQARISELEDHIKTLTLRATTAMERATEYETSLKRMNSMSSAGRSTPEPGASSSMPAGEAQSPQTSQTSMAASPERAPSRGAFARLIPTRMPSLRSAASSPAPSAQIRSVPSLAESAMSAERPKQFPLLSHTPPTPVAATTYVPSAAPGSTLASDLQARLDQEQNLRRAAEAETEKTKSEIEELTEKLFSEANKLVADERKARDRLEKRVEVLERRDQEKNKRLGMLDMRVQRIERVRQMLSEKVPLADKDKEEERDRSPGRQVDVTA